MSKDLGHLVNNPFVMKIAHALCYLLCDYDHLGDIVKFCCCTKHDDHCQLYQCIFVIYDVANIDITITSKIINSCVSGILYV